MAQALSLGTTHLSLYQLTIEPGTRFAAMVAPESFEPLDADAAASLYELTDAMTSAAGLPAYEISNHARPGHESRHNLTYWRYGDYAGVGPVRTGGGLAGAPCATGSRRISSRRSRATAMASSRKPRSRRDEAADEALVMGLAACRRRSMLEAIADRFGLTEVVDWRRVDRLVASGHLERDGHAHRADARRPPGARLHPRRNRRCRRA